MRQIPLGIHGAALAFPVGLSHPRTLNDAHPTMKLSCLILCCFLPWVTTLLSADKVDVSLKWKTGAHYTQRVSVDQVVGIPRHGQATAHTKLDLGIHVTGTKESSKILKLSYDGLKIDVDLPAPMLDKEFDSAKPNEGNEDMAAIFAKMRESNTEVVVDGRGKVTDVRGAEKIAATDSLLSRFLGREQLRSLVQQGWLMDVPAKPLGKGETWPFRMKFPTPLGDVILKGQYKLAGEEKFNGIPCVRIDMLGEVAGNLSNGAALESVDDEAKRMHVLLTAMGLKIDEGTVSGQLLFDPRLGQIRRSEVETRVKIGVAKYPENGQPAAIPLHQKIVSTIEGG